MSYDQLENAQWDILASSSYMLGAGDAQPFIDELWLALPTLRALLSWTGALDAVESETWGRLYWAITGEHICLLIRIPEMFNPSYRTGRAEVPSVIADQCCIDGRCHSYSGSTTKGRTRPAQSLVPHTRGRR